MQLGRRTFRDTAVREKWVCWNNHIQYLHFCKRVVDDTRATTWRYREANSDGPMFTRRNAPLVIAVSSPIARVLVSLCISGRASMQILSRTILRERICRNDPRRQDHIMRINHSDKRQPLLPILLPQNCALILRVSYNKSDHHYCYFCLAAACSGFLNYALPLLPLERLVQLRSAKLRRDVVIKVQ